MRASAPDDGTIAQIKAALSRIPAFSALKFVDIKKGPDGYGAALGNKALSVAIFPAGEKLKAGVQGARRSGAHPASRRERARRLRAERKARKSRARRQRVEHTARSKGNRQPTVKAKGSPSKSTAGLLVPAATGKNWNVAFAQSSFSFGQMAKGRFGILEDAHLKSVSFVVAQADNGIRVADLPKTLQPSLKSFVNKDGILALRQGVNFFGEIDRFSGLLQEFQHAFGIKSGPVRLQGSVGGDFIRHFASGRSDAKTQDINDVRLGLDLPGIRPRELQGMVDSDRISLRFHASKGKIEGSGKTTIRVRLKARPLSVHTSLQFNDAPAEGEKFVTVTGTFPKPGALLTHIPNLKVTRLGVDFAITRLKGNKKETRFDLAGAARFKTKPVTLTARFIKDGKDKARTDIAITSDKLTFADFVPGHAELPALKAVKIRDVHLSNRYVSATARFRKEDTTVYIFASKGKKAPNILLVHDEFKFSDYVPKLKGTLLDDLGRLENAMFLYVPKGNVSSGKKSHTLAMGDLPRPVIPKFSGGGKKGKHLDFKAGLNFLGDLDIRTKGAAKTLLQKIGMESLKKPHLPLRGILDPAILQPGKEKAKQFAIQIIESINITAPLPNFKPKKFPGGMDFKNVVFSVKGEKEPSQTDHARVDVSIKGDISLAIHGTRLDLIGGLEMDKEIGGQAKALKFSAVAKSDWDHPLGLRWLSLKEIGISVDLEETAQKSKDLDFKIDAKASIKRKKPVSVEGELVVLNGKIEDVIFRIPSKIDVKDLPHIGKIKGVNQFSFSNLAISTRELAGELTWKPRNITQKAALYFGGKKRDHVTLLYSLENLSFGKLIPKLAGTKVGRIKLPKFVLTLSTHPVTQASIGQLPREVRNILSGISEDPTYRMDIAKGVGMIAPLDPKLVGGDLKKALEKLDITDPVVLGGAVGGILGGVPHLNLKARMPRIPIPKGTPKFLKFAKDVSGAVYLDYAGSVIDLGVEADVHMRLGLGDPKPKLVTAQLGVELGGSSGAGLRATGSMTGTWHDAMGMVGLNLKDVTFKFGVDADSAIVVGLKATEIIERDRISYTILVALIPEILTPTKLAFEFDAQEFGIDTYLAMGDIYLRTAVAQPFFTRLLGNALKKAGAKKAAQSVDWYEQKIRNAPTLNQMLRVGELPLIHFKKVKAKLVMPGSGDPQLDLEPGLALGGQLWLGKRELGEVKSSLNFMGLSVYGNIPLKNIGPLKINKATVDLAASIGLDPHFKIMADARFLGIRQDLEIYVGKKGFRFKRINDLGPMGKLTLNAHTVGTDLVHLKDFTIDGSFSTDFNPWLAAQLTQELRTGTRALDHIASDVAAAQRALQHMKELAKARKEVLKKAQRALDAINKKIEKLPGGKRAVKFEKWLLGELNTGKKNVAAAKKALIKDAKILAYKTAHESAIKAQSAIQNLAGSFSVNSATIHGSLQDSLHGKPAKLHLDAVVSGHRIKVDAGIPLARPQDLNIISLVQAIYHVIKSDLFGRRT